MVQKKETQYNSSQENKNKNLILHNQSNPVNFKITQKQREILNNRVDFWLELAEDKQKIKPFVKTLRYLSDLKPIIDELLGEHKETVYNWIEKLLIGLF